MMILKINRNSNRVRNENDDLNQWLFIDNVDSFDMKTFIPHKRFISHTQGDQSNPQDIIREFLEANYTHVILDSSRIIDSELVVAKTPNGGTLWYDDYVTELVIYDESDGWTTGTKKVRLSIVFNTYAYIMNDKGQTVEKFTH